MATAIERSAKKFTKREVGFEHPAKGSDHCMECEHYEPGRDKCQIVAGEIQPQDWCRKFEAK